MVCEACCLAREGSALLAGQRFMIGWRRYRTPVQIRIASDTGKQSQRDNGNHGYLVISAEFLAPRFPGSGGRTVSQRGCVVEPIDGLTPLFVTAGELGCHITGAGSIRELIATCSWLTGYQLPPYAPEPDPIEEAGRT